MLETCLICGNNCIKQKLQPWITLADTKYAQNVYLIVEANKKYQISIVFNFLLPTNKNTEYLHFLYLRQIQCSLKLDQDLYSDLHSYQQKLWQEQDSSKRNRQNQNKILTHYQVWFNKQDKTKPSTQNKKTVKHIEYLVKKEINRKTQGNCISQQFYGKIRICKQIIGSQLLRNNKESSLNRQNNW